MVRTFLMLALGGRVGTLERVLVYKLSAIFASPFHCWSLHCFELHPPMALCKKSFIRSALFPY